MKKGHAQFVAALLSGVMISALTTGTAVAQQTPDDSAQAGDAGHLGVPNDGEIQYGAQLRAKF